jgi:hypothetical protein
MNFCIITNYNDLYKNIAQITLPNICYYSNKYLLDFYKTHINYTYKPIVWNRIPIIEKILPNYDWVMWMDIDCLFVNMNMNILDFIDNNYFMVAGVSESGNYVYKPNRIEAGVFLIKNCPLSFEFLHKVFTEIRDKNHNWQEQHNMEVICHTYPHFNEKIKRIDSRLINSIEGQFESLSEVFIYHYAHGQDIDLNKKVMALKNINDQISY